eukprot:TRINITY_DN26955_c0_g1_i3.p4 TRINITY_DN26955_c0_g1~~TRINITY_DN26955_c0_g1_i3.p4  ORF type:complete len:111 (-),score=18.23 TRINITY_DN26955_c0_g1_i3:117-449(-)
MWAAGAESLHPSLADAHLQFLDAIFNREIANIVEALRTALLQEVYGFNIELVAGHRQLTLKVRGSGVEDESIKQIRQILLWGYLLKAGCPGCGMLTEGAGHFGSRSRTLR